MFFFVNICRSLKTIWFARKTSKIIIVLVDELLLLLCGIISWTLTVSFSHSMEKRRLPAPLIWAVWRWFSCSWIEAPTRMPRTRWAAKHPPTTRPIRNNEYWKCRSYFNAIQKFIRNVRIYYLEEYSFHMCLRRMRWCLQDKTLLCVYVVRLWMTSMLEVCSNMSWSLAICLTLIGWKHCFNPLRW